MSEPAWVDPNVKDSTGTATTSVDIEAGDVGAAVAGDQITILANFWKFGSIAANSLYALLFLLEVLEAPFQIHAILDKIIMSLIMGAGVYGALKFIQWLVMPPVLVYVFYAVWDILSLHWIHAIYNLIFAIPQVMLIREIRRGIQASPPTPTAEEQ